MSPTLALVLTSGFVTWLLLRDASRRTEASWALWLPLAWLFFAGTRFASQWLALGQQIHDTTSETGSPLDAVIFGALTLLGCVVLLKRRVMIADLARQNPWILALLAYGLVSIVWSDFPFVSLKRWVKALGNPVMALIILTDANPSRAFRTVISRFAYLVLPFSIMFIKYFPEYGRGFDAWTGAGFNRGIALTKNGLGLICLTMCLMLAWNLQVIRREVEAARRPFEWWITAGLLFMSGWLLYMSNSKTSQLVLLLCVAILVALKWSSAVRLRFTLWFIAATVIAVAAEWGFDIYARVVTTMGRETNLTDRTEVWKNVIALQPNVLLGAGYEAFWLGERLEVLWSTWWWQPNQAHNGYLEMYANGGLIGLGLLLGMIVSAFRSIARDLKAGSESEIEWARLRMVFLLAIVLYNYTEATFKGVSVLWTLFYLIAWRSSARATSVGREYQAYRARSRGLTQRS